MSSHPATRRRKYAAQTTPASLPPISATPRIASASPPIRRGSPSHPLPPPTAQPPQTHHPSLVLLVLAPPPTPSEGWVLDPPHVTPVTVVTPVTPSHQSHSSHLTHSSHSSHFFHLTLLCS